MQAAPSSMLFLASAWLAMGAFVLLGSPGETLILWLTATAVIAGLPHGALDALVLRHLERGRWWLIGLLLYALVAGLVLVSWNLFPGMTLGAFLGIAWFHFGVSDGLLAPAPQRIIEGFTRGGAPLTLSAMFHGERVAELFAILAGQEAAGYLVEVLAILFWPWCLAFAWAIMAAFREKKGQAALELATLAGLFALLPPLVAFSIYFALLHAPRSLAATLQYCGVTQKGWFFDASWPTLATIAVAMWIMLGEMTAAPLDEALVRVLFAGLAAVTFPHVLLWAILAARENPLSRVKINRIHGS